MNKGDIIKALVTVVKVKNNVPTVVSIGGRRYVLQAPDQFRGKKEVERK